MQFASSSFDRATKKRAAAGSDTPLANGLRATLSTMTRRAASLTSVTALAFTTAFAPLAPIALTSQAHAQSRAAQSYVKIDPASSHEPKRIYLGLNKSLVVDLPADAHDILVANPSVADAVTRTARRIYLFGKEVGQTNVFVFDGKGKQIAAMEISIERDIAGLEETLGRLIRNSDIRAEMINDNIVLTGSVVTPQDAARAVALAEVFVTGGEATQGSSTTGGNSLAAIFGSEPSSRVVNLLKIAGEDQVHLKVVVAEIQRSVVKQLGIQSGVTNPGGTGAADSVDGFGFGVFGAGSFSEQVLARTSASLGIEAGANRLSATLTALERTGVMRTLAEPSLTAVSGEKAHFRAGGTYKVPQQIESCDGGITFTDQELGVALTFTPVVLTEGRISLKIRTEVSEPTNQGATAICPNVNFIGVRQRMADTVVELPSGGSMVIGGLIQDDVRQVVSGTPGLKDLPFFGSLFRSREFVRNESEIVVMVTPYLVRPVARKKLAQPDENFQPASDAAGYFMGRINRVYGTKQGNLPKGRYTGSIGFILK
ncbi:MAG: type II and III secretion system protein family protein [Pseudomonadota bacterium]